MFWLGRGGSVEHAISGIDIALWDLCGKALGQPVSRLLGGNYRDRIKPYASILFDDPPLLREKLHEQLARGFRAIKMGWRPFGRVSRKFDELLIKTARETVGDDVELMVDAGGSEQFWPHGVTWARETARMLGDYGVVWFEEALRPDDVDGFRELRANFARADRHAAKCSRGGNRFSRSSPRAPSTSFSPTDQVRRPERRRGGSAGWPTTTACCWCRTAGTRPSAWRPTWPSSAAMPVARWVEYQTGVPYIEEILATPFQLDADGMLRIPTGPGLGIELNRDAIVRYSR